jgi:hypothetical protein
MNVEREQVRVAPGNRGIRHVMHDEPLGCRVARVVGGSDRPGATAARDREESRTERNESRRAGGNQNSTSSPKRMMRGGP